MTDINKQALIEQIDAAIEALDVPNDATQELSFYIKTAINAGTSISDIGTEIASRVASIDTLSDVEEVLLLSVATSLITRDRIVTVSDLSTLQGFASDISAGTIYYVESEGAPYIKKTNGTWVLLDPSIQPLATINGWAWGNNLDGKLGDNSQTNRSSPVSIVGGVSDWVFLDSSSNHSFGIRSNGTIWGWGWNNAGMLGDGTTISRSSPVPVVGGFEDWILASVGNVHCVGLRANGTAWSWGINTSGQLGIGSTESKNSPVSIVGDFTDWVYVDSGISHSFGVRAGGTAWGWGTNSSGQLGDGTNSGRSSPVSIVGGFTDWTQVSGGNQNSAGIRANGTMWAWGSGDTGRLGDGTTISKSSPVSVVGGYTDWSRVDVGLSHLLALRANGTAWAWGLNGGFGNYGSLGDGTIVNRSSPVSVVGGYTDWVGISAGDNNSSGVRANGTAWAWGKSNFGNLGDGTTINKSSPVSVVGGFTDWVQVNVGSNHSLGLRIA